MNKMNVYRCDRNGKNNKLLFTQNVDDENGYIIPEEFTAKKITFAVSSEKLSGSEENPVIEYGVITWNNGNIDCSPEYSYKNSYDYPEVSSF